MTIASETASIELKGLDQLLKATLPMGRIELQPLPHCDGLTLALIGSDFPLGPLPADVMRDVIATPAYWAFCWGSGLALARFLFDAPEWVRGRSVLDLDALAESVDIVLMADVLYDRSNLPLLARASAVAAEVLVADSRIRALPDDRYRLIAQMDARTYPNLEFDEFTSVRIFHRGMGQNT